MLRECPMTEYTVWPQGKCEESLQVEAPTGFPEEAAKRYCRTADYPHFRIPSERAVVVRSPDGSEKTFVVTLRSEPTYTAKEVPCQPNTGPPPSSWRCKVRP